MSRTLAEQLQPIIALQGALRSQPRPRVDLAAAAARLRTGRPAFDAAPSIVAAGDLQTNFDRTSRAFEATGMASAASVAAVRKLSTDARQLVLAWANSDFQDRSAVQRLARSIAAVVGNAILAHAAAQVIDALDLSEWKWPQCPCCGASPDLALAGDRERMLVCWRCDTMWRAHTSGCLGCGERDPLAISRVPSPYVGYQLAVCNTCGRYLKERSGSLTHDLLVERALTEGLDQAAQQRGLRT